MKTIITDGGKPVGLNENNMDCAVRALANASGIAYELAYICFEDAGRQPGKPAPMIGGLQNFEKNSFGIARPIYVVRSTRNPRRAADYYPTVAQFIQEHPKGRYIVRVGLGVEIKHVFAVVDGQAMDNYQIRPRQRVIHAWKVETR